MPWVKLDSLALPKLLGGWGLKNIHSFSTALTAKIGWRLISSNNLWSKVVTQKYIGLNFVVDWIRRSVRSFQNGSIMWKALVKYFSIISQGLAWKVGKGIFLRIGMDLWLGRNVLHILPHNLIDRLHERGIFHLNHITDEHQTTP